jgi:hypothetical protein
MVEQEDSRGRMMIERESAKLERSRARAQALEENMSKTISAHMKQVHVKKAIAQEAMDATENPGRRDEIFAKAGNGTYDNDRDVVTGREPRPWEN